MKKLMMRMTIVAVALLALVFIPGSAIAEDSVEGSVQGFTCVTQGKVCPVGYEDPMAAAEQVFVVLTPGKDYYFVPNVDRAVLARHINHNVRVYGVLSSNFNAITADQIDYFYKGAWITSWTGGWQKRIDEMLQQAD